MESTRDETCGKYHMLDQSTLPRPAGAAVVTKNLEMTLIRQSKAHHFGQSSLQAYVILPGAHPVSIRLVSDSAET